MYVMTAGNSSTIRFGNFAEFPRCSDLVFPNYTSLKYGREVESYCVLGGGGGGGSGMCLWFDGKGWGVD